MNLAPFKSKGVVDYLFDFAKGVNNGIDYALIPKDQMSFAKNTTVRGSFVGPRSPFRKITLTAEGYVGASVLAQIASGRYQGCCYYKPDSGTESLMVAISGRLYRIAITGNTALVSDVTIVGDPNDSAQPRNWLWQAEKYIIVTDGTPKVPIFYDGTTSVRSNYGTPVVYTANNLGPFNVPAIGTEVAAPVAFDNVTALAVGDVITYRLIGSFTVQAIAGANVTLLNVSALPEGRLVGVSADAPISWVKTGKQLPPGRMGTYGLGRVWMSLVDGKQFVAGDIVGSSSGTVAENFRDSVLQITENLYLSGGGNFNVPGSYGEIRAMCFSETLDSSLGQGALQVFTPMTVFSCNSPVDRATWQDVTNPILTESAKGGGGLGQWSTINVNSDILSRAYDGIRSLILTRREFNTWGNVPVSREIQPQMERDSETLLGYTSSVAFDNRFLMTTEGRIVEDRGVVWERLAVINNDPVSSLQGKAPSVYDSVYWQGLNVFQLVRGEFAERERCFAFTLNEITDEIELYEILRSSDPIITDEGDRDIVWSFESPMIDFGQRDPRLRDRLRLGQARLSVNNLRGTVAFQAYFRPEYWPCWVPWCSWEACSDNESVTETSPSFRPNMILPEPDARWCDPTNNRPLREGYFFQIRLVVTGYCKVVAMKLRADTVPEPVDGPPECSAICPS